ncbi:MAG: tRNA lysidine(34) synthetase TilS [Alphaproteobacteria bacterium]
MSALSGRPVARAEFARLMASFGPFESRPHLAVAVSGGRDSMALALLAQRWAESRGGRITALTVDHGLRPESRAEARRVRRWLAARGIAHRTLVWTGPKPKANLQSEARAARYSLLAAWCERHGVLHLALAHQAEDQAETFLLRLARGSGIDGLAGMAGVSELPSVRLLRPLLAVPRARLAATLREAGQDWVDDPTNENTAHARIRLRRLHDALAAEGLTVERLTGTARHMAAARAASEAEVAALLARAVRLHPAGFCAIDGDAWRCAAEPTALRALASILQTIGGAAYPPRYGRLARLARAFMDGTARGFTLGGCRIARGRDAWLVSREPAAMAGAVPLVAGRAVRWDDRFSLVWSGRAVPRGRALRVGPLGQSREARVHCENRAASVPQDVCPTLPAAWRGPDLIAAPHFGEVSRALAAFKPLTCRFSPPEPLSGAWFAVVSRGGYTI